MKIVNGASLQPKSGAKPGQIVLLLHGFGSNGRDMVALAPAWQQSMPDALFLAPHAPQACAMGTGYQWWPLADISPAALARGAASAAPAIDSFIDRKLEQYGLGEADLAIVGFSQGAMMALHVGLRRPKAAACLVGYSGMLTGAPQLQHALVSKPPVLLVHGAQDPVVPVAALHDAERVLKHLDIEVRTHISQNTGHIVDPAGLRLGGEFVARALGL
ncbi:alpha/beta hydrolase [Novosphingobium sp. JCM 18896]|uniref:alpha/beta hydrolase n=1 Tax=Novosphingobium sp. JCM 18896 TaxID=2989731 RepID=UPI002223B643|nr:dienelactone hydrolase family protein [Novosphingobium sp. JCM 18896]MCW1430259.1 dienelactone hydrolase family protein [Novosphingobium sp. JCM 18896]